MSMRQLFISTRSKRPTRLHLERLEPRTVPATFTVTNTADAGAGSLRQATLDANALAGADTITFDSAVFNMPHVITLTSGALTTSEFLTIIGPGPDRLTVSGNNASAVIVVGFYSTLIPALT